LRSRLDLDDAPPAMNVHRLLLLAIPLIPAAVAIACGGGNENLPPPPPPPAPPPSDTAAPVASAPPSASVDTPAPPPPPPVTLTLGTASPDPAAPLPTVKFVSPTMNQIIPAAKSGDFIVKLDVKNWQTATGSSHVHLILDDRPYKPIYDPKAPVKLSDLPGGDALAPGQHVLVAFPSRANHESVKTAGALTMLQFWIDKKGDAPVDLKKPLLIYSRPKGDYKADMASHVLIDFQLANDKLAQGGDHVHVTVNGPGADGLTADATTFGPPFFLDNLQDGAYQVKLDLFGADGKPVAGPWSSVTRSINLAHQQ
jgi:hypothetical protein